MGVRVETVRYARVKWEVDDPALPSGKAIVYGQADQGYCVCVDDAYYVGPEGAWGMTRHSLSLCYNERSEAEARVTAILQGRWTPQEEVEDSNAIPD